jgi:hypothetical protein
MVKHGALQAKFKGANKRGGVSNVGFRSFAVLQYNVAGGEMFGIGKKRGPREELQELHRWIAASCIGFAATVTEAFEKSAPVGEKPSYDLLFSNGPPKQTRCHLNQMLLAVEGLCFFLHALDRLSYQRQNEKLRELVFDSSAAEMVRLFIELIRTQTGKNDPDVCEDGLIGWINERASQYGKAPALLGKDINDRNTVLWIASCAIAEAVNYPKHIILVLEIKNALTRELIEMDLANRLNRIAALL